MKKIIRILFFASIGLLLIEGFAYFNIRVSEKYEVDLMTTHRSITGEKDKTNDIEIRKVELEKQKHDNKTSIVITSTILLLLSLALIYNNTKKEKK
ncbi:MAG: hypothetical protein M0P66_15535 [Salinivirgaceae bacterium]|nr:hypothetical protein [Salinivirgaceae bacterium]